MWYIYNNEEFLSMYKTCFSYFELITIKRASPISTARHIYANRKLQTSLMKNQKLTSQASTK